MFLLIVGEYQNIVNEHYHTFVQLFHEDFVHQVHEVSRGIGQSK
jgi:hypothetical protein